MRRRTLQHAMGIIGILMLRHVLISAAMILIYVALGEESAAAQQEAELAKQLQNPIAELVSVPLQNNWDFGIGPADAMRYTLNVQPVIPFSLNDNWNLITRTIMPVIYAESPTKGGRDKSGLGDILQSFFLSPKAPVHGWIVGAGPAFLYPSATDAMLGSEKWAGAHSRHATPGERLDVWHPREPTRVFCRYRLQTRRERHLRATVPCLHNQDIHDVHF